MGFGNILLLILVALASYLIIIYNAIVRDNNAKTESFPDLFVAHKFNFEKRDYFELAEDEAAVAQKMPKIDL